MMCWFIPWCASLHHNVPVCVIMCWFNCFHLVFHFLLLLHHVDVVLVSFNTLVSFMKTTHFSELFHFNMLVGFAVLSNSIIVVSFTDQTFVTMVIFIC